MGSVNESDLEDDRPGDAQHENRPGVAPLELPESRGPRHGEEEDQGRRDEAREVEGVGISHVHPILDHAQARRPDENDDLERRLRPSRGPGAGGCRRNGPDYGG